LIGVRVDLNADIGESSSVDTAGPDELLLRTITSGNIACGEHAGTPSVMRHTVRMALGAGVSIGAHPSFPDRDGFGRREMSIDPGEIVDIVQSQIERLRAIANAEGAFLRHVKPHGALYNMSAKRADIAEAVAAAVASIDRGLLLVGLPGSELLSAGERCGLRVAAEGFADRSYEADGSLTPRHLSDAVISDAGRVAERAMQMVRDGNVVARDGTLLKLRIDTICVHGDTPDAATLARAVRIGLEQAGIVVQPL
jgi:UPF0271 protein